VRMYDKVRTRWSEEIKRLETALAKLSGEEHAAQEAKIACMKATDMAVIVSPGQNEKDDMAASRPLRLRHVPSPAISFPERAEGVKGPKRLAELGGLPP
jgi:hypothetical protein